MKKVLQLVAVLIISYTNAQNTLIVDNNLFIDDSPAHLYSTFSTAIAAASNGDTILIQPSQTTYGAITINKSVTILGMGHAPDLNSGVSSTVASISISANNIKISGLYVTGAFTTSANISNLLVENCTLATGLNLTSATNSNHTFRGNIIKNVVNLSSSNYANSLNFTFSNNVFQNLGAGAFSYFNETTIFNNNIIIADQALVGYVIFNAPNNVICQNNIWLFTNNTMAVVDQTGGTPVVHNNSMTYHYGSPTITALNGTGNLDNQNPFFVSIPANNPYWTPTNNYNLGASSVGNDAGTDGNDVGIFNGYYDFDIKGYPTELPYIIDMTISNNMVPAGADLNVNLKANANKSN